MRVRGACVFVQELTNGLAPLEEFGLLGLFTAPLNEKALLNRIVRYVNRLRKALAVCGEVALHPMAVLCGPF